ncbi:MAG TPA: hypothetical protein VGP64_05270 [Polyangia bacterium]
MKVNTAGLFSLAHTAHQQDREDGGELEIVEAEGPPAPPRAEAPAAPRMRKTTLENFNDEMSVLDHPLEEEVEFYDEPRPRRWRVPAIGGVIFFASCAAYLGLRHWSTAEAAAAPAAAPAVMAASAVAATSPPAPPPAAPAAVEASGAPPAAAPAAGAPAPVVADASGAGPHHHHHAGHANASAHHHRHHGGHGHHARA